MNKEKFHIPMPDEKTIQVEIGKIVTAGLKPHRTLPSFLVEMYKTVGLKHLFVNKRDGIIITLTVMASLIFVLCQMAEADRIKEGDIYSVLFLVSPLLYLTLTLYDILYKHLNQTYEMEVVAKYNVYQIAAFRMLVFSIISILVNTVSILTVVGIQDNMSFMRAFMISMTALFIFSFLFLVALMRKRTSVIVFIVISGWIGLNIGFQLVNKQGYIDFLVHLPLLVYGVVLLISIVVYFMYLNKLVKYRLVEGV